MRQHIDKVFALCSEVIDINPSDDEGGCQVAIYIAKTVEYCYSNEDGEVIYQLICDHLDAGQKVTLSFKNVCVISSNFISSSLLQLLDDHEFGWIKENLKIVDSTKYINDLIKRSFLFETKRKCT